MHALKASAALRMMYFTRCLEKSAVVCSGRGLVRDRVLESVFQSLARYLNQFDGGAERIDGQYVLKRYGT